MDSQLSFDLWRWFFCLKGEVKEIKISEILGAKPKENKRRKATIGLIITGLLSIVLVFVTVYGQFTGNYLITVTRQASLKGIAISENVDFDKDYDTLKITPLNDVEDTLESDLDVDNALNTDGQYHHSNHYIAYTFYLRNSGQETVNVDYQVKIIDDYRHLGQAVIFRMIEYELVNDEFLFVSDEKYSRSITDTEIIANVEIKNFKPNDKRRFTFFVWIDGDLSGPEMLGGAIKIELNFGIRTAGREDE